MNKKVLVISTSLRSKSNSERMAEEFMKGAVATGNQVEFISLAGKEIGFCLGCLTCQQTQKCIICDDAMEIAEKMKESEVIAFASPIYYYEMTGQMKTLLDRMNPLFPSDYQFRDVYSLTCAADEEENTLDKAVNGLRGWVECFPKAELKGTVFAGGVTGAGEIEGREALIKSYEMGKSV